MKVLKNVVKSRKIWGASLGSIAILIALYIDTNHTGTAVAALGAIWAAAIGGQAVRDYVEERNNRDVTTRGVQGEV